MLVIQAFSQNGDKYSANGVAKGHYNKVAKGFNAPQVCYGKEIHISDAVFKAAEDKDHNGEKYCKYLSHRVLDSFIAVCGNEHKYSAEK